MPCFFDIKLELTDVGAEIMLACEVHDIAAAVGEEYLQGAIVAARAVFIVFSNGTGRIVLSHTKTSRYRPGSFFL